MLKESLGFASFFSHTSTDKMSGFILAEIQVPVHVVAIKILQMKNCHV